MAVQSMEIAMKQTFNAPVEYLGKLKNLPIDLATLINSVAWEHREAPRKEAFYSKLTSPYTYGRGEGIRTYYPQVIPDFLKPIWEKVEQEAGTLYEACFLNYYLTSRDHLGWHADNSDVIDDNRSIAVLTFGAEREIWFGENPIEKKQKPLNVEKLVLESESLLIMKPGMQDTHMHRIPKHHAECGPRISLTFRGLI